MSRHDIEVSRLNRELRSFPVRNSQPKRLTPDQIRFFNENGYLAGFGVFDESEPEEVRAHAAGRTGRDTGPASPRPNDDEGI